MSGFRTEEVALCNLETKVHFFYLIRFNKIIENNFFIPTNG